MNEEPAPGWDCHVHVFDTAAPALPGHYGPATRTLNEIETVAATQGVGHLVLVQPSVYGSDHRVLLRALATAPGRHRAVAVVDADVSEAELDTLHQAGVRGVRFNRVSPVGQHGDPTPLLRSLAPLLRERGWHVQWYLRAAELALLPPLQDESGLPFVLDHLAGLSQTLRADDTAWTALAALAAGGAWVKLSGWYRLDAALPYGGLHKNIAHVAGLFGDRLVWGSDWPHTGQAVVPPYAATWAPVAAALPAALGERVRTVFPAALYG